MCPPPRPGGLCGIYICAYNLCMYVFTSCVCVKLGQNGKVPTAIRSHDVIGVLSA